MSHEDRAKRYDLQPGFTPEAVEVCLRRASLARSQAFAEAAGKLKRTMGSLFHRRRQRVAVAPRLPRHAASPH